MNTVDFKNLQKAGLIIALAEMSDKYNLKRLNNTILGNRNTYIIEREGKDDIIINFDDKKDYNSDLNQILQDLYQDATGKRYFKNPNENQQQYMLATAGNLIKEEIKNNNLDESNLFNQLFGLFQGDGFKSLGNILDYLKRANGLNNEYSALASASTFGGYVLSNLYNDFSTAEIARLLRKDLNLLNNKDKEFHDMFPWTKLDDIQDSKQLAELNKRRTKLITLALISGHLSNIGQNSLLDNMLRIELPNNEYIMHNKTCARKDTDKMENELINSLLKGEKYNLSEDKLLPRLYNVIRENGINYDYINEFISGFFSIDSSAPIGTASNILNALMLNLASLKGLSINGSETIKKFTYEEANRIFDNNYDIANNNIFFDVILKNAFLEKSVEDKTNDIPNRLARLKHILDLVDNSDNSTIINKLPKLMQELDDININQLKVAISASNNPTYIMQMKELEGRITPKNNNNTFLKILSDMIEDDEIAFMDMFEEMYNKELEKVINKDRPIEEENPDNLKLTANEEKILAGVMQGDLDEFAKKYGLLELLEENKDLVIQLYIAQLKEDHPELFSDNEDGQDDGKGNPSL